MTDKFKLFYKTYTHRIKIDDTTYEIEYHRNPFWAGEKQNLRTFLKDKLCWWYGSVWQVEKNGKSKVACGFNYIVCVNALFPKKRMKKILEAKANYFHTLGEKK